MNEHKTIQIAPPLVSPAPPLTPSKLTEVEALRDQKSEADDGPISPILAAMIFLGEEKYRLMVTILVGALLAAGLAWTAVPMFTAKTIIIPPQQQQSAALNSALAGLGSLGASAASMANIKSADELFLALMRSNTVRDRLIERFDLKSRYQAKFVVDARKRIESLTKLQSEKKAGLISIEYTDKDPAFAAQMANAYVEELSALLARIAVTDAQQRRVFLEGQLKQTKEKFAEAEIQLRQQQMKSGVVSLDAQAQGAIKSSLDIRAQIAQREVELGILRTYATPQNADVQRLGAELAGLRSQLQRLEQGSGQDYPEQNRGVETIRAYREVKYQEAIMDALVRQYELAKVDEAKEGPLLQQVDQATPPERRSSPKRMLMVLIGAVCGLLVGLALAAWLRLRRASRASANVHVQRLRTAWSWLPSR